MYYSQEYKIYYDKDHMVIELEDGTEEYFYVSWEEYKKVLPYFQQENE